jgi:hypothetical protein
LGDRARRSQDIAGLTPSLAGRYGTTFSLTVKGSGFAGAVVSSDEDLRWRFNSFRCFFASSFWRFAKA